jgi:hypothetical protein
MRANTGIPLHCDLEREAVKTTCIFVPVTVGCETSHVAWWSDLLTTNHEIPGSILPWEFSLAGEDPHSDHGLASL